MIPNSLNPFGLEDRTLTFHVLDHNDNEVTTIPYSSRLYCYATFPEQVLEYGSVWYSNSSCEGTKYKSKDDTNTDAISYMVYGGSNDLYFKIESDIIRTNTPFMLGITPNASLTKDCTSDIKYVEIGLEGNSKMGNVDYQEVQKNPIDLLSPMEGTKGKRYLQISYTNRYIRGSNGVNGWIYSCVITYFVLHLYKKITSNGETTLSSIGRIHISEDRTKELNYGGGVLGEYDGQENWNQYDDTRGDVGEATYNIDLKGQKIDDYIIGWDETNGLYIGDKNGDIITDTTFVLRLEYSASVGSPGSENGTAGRETSVHGTTIALSNQPFE